MGQSAKINGNQKHWKKLLRDSQKNQPQKNSHSTTPLHWFNHVISFWTEDHHCGPQEFLICTSTWEKGIWIKLEKGCKSFQNDSDVLTYISCRLRVGVMPGWSIVGLEQKRIQHCVCSLNGRHMLLNTCPVSIRKRSVTEMQRIWLPQAYLEISHFYALVSSLPLICMNKNARTILQMSWWPPT